MTTPLVPFSVAELQGALRALRARQLVEDPAHAKSVPVVDAPGTRPRAQDRPRLPQGVGSWGAVLAAHPGAGASTVALAVAEAVARAKPVCLVELAPSARSGLAASTSAELGVDGTGRWRRGARGQITVYRRANDDETVTWPVVPAAWFGLADLGVVEPEDVPAIAERAAVVVACRASIPGLRAAEHLLRYLAPARPVAIAAVGDKRISREAELTLGPRLRQLRLDGQIVLVPEDARLRVTGPSSAPLPTPVAVAGKRLAELAGLSEAVDRHPRRRSGVRPTERKR